ncbi:hypothetical protein AAFF_G00095590 [Aldrovandia affinis]|uniref:Uncharacterized protein n=1 Tax=Aldrovandia affinis TaxID=143900 RepID=A0AAD7RVR8_9TELE|nr:hypothetical protein AAFF_G00095590 [Aldrovandia affinis]
MKGGTTIEITKISLDNQKPFICSVPLSSGCTEPRRQRLSPGDDAVPPRDGSAPRALQEAPCARAPETGLHQNPATRVTAPSRWGGWGAEGASWRRWWKTSGDGVPGQIKARTKMKGEVSPLWYVPRERRRAGGGVFRSVTG